MPRRLLLPLLLLIPAVAIAFAMPGGLQAAAWHHLSAALLELQGLASTNPAAASVIYTVLYVATVLLFIPMAPALGVGGGAILGPVLGTCCAVIAATSGAFVMMLLARRVLGPRLPPKQRDRIHRLRPLLERNGFGLVLTLRLTIVTPSWLVNVAAGLAGMRAAPFVGATVIGILPATIVFTSLGASLGEALASATPPGLGLILRPGVLAALALLTLTALLPLALRGRGRLLSLRG
ncbi:MAG TPA: VTT domain-containing protein [Acetobacteraceae bacterium]|nr:VTT domain-containing protein [Acetobacteraceae bacterium]